MEGKPLGVGDRLQKDQAMNCPECTSETMVIDSRPTDANMIRRRRECLSCEERFTTYELPLKGSPVSVSMESTHGRLVLGQAGDLRVVVDAEQAKPRRKRGRPKKRTKR